MSDCNVAPYDERTDVPHCNRVPENCCQRCNFSPLVASRAIPRRRIYVITQFLDLYEILRYLRKPVTNPAIFAFRKEITLESLSKTALYARDLT